MDYGYIICVRQVTHTWDNSFRILNQKVFTNREEAKDKAYRYFSDFLRKFPKYHKTSELTLSATDGNMIFEVYLYGLYIE